jgi:hypothetical protein
MATGIDRTFMHCSIRTQDLEVINKLCVEKGLDPVWLTDFILKVFHEQKVSNVELKDDDVEKIINKALNEIK